MSHPLVSFVYHDVWWVSPSFPWFIMTFESTPMPLCLSWRLMFIMTFGESIPLPLCLSCLVVSPSPQSLSLTFDSQTWYHPLLFVTFDSQTWHHPLLFVTFDSQTWHHPLLFVTFDSQTWHHPFVIRDRLTTSGVIPSAVIVKFSSSQ